MGSVAFQAGFVPPAFCVKTARVGFICAPCNLSQTRAMSRELSQEERSRGHLALDFAGAMTLSTSKPSSGDFPDGIDKIVKQLDSTQKALVEPGVAFNLFQLCFFLR